MMKIVQSIKIYLGNVKVLDSEKVVLSLPQPIHQKALFIKTNGTSRH